MTQKILAGRADDPHLSGDLVHVKVDQVILARDPDRTLVEVVHAGFRKCAVEVGIAYESRCITSAANPNPSSYYSREALQLGMLIARPGIGFPAPVHLERFGSPGRLAVTDEPRLAGIGGAGMLTCVIPPTQLAEALGTGSIGLRAPRSIQVLLTGRLRPFVCVRDVGLELLRRGLSDAIRRVDAQYGAPVVLEFAGPSARLLSVSERSVLAALAPELGAGAAVFVSDEKTEVYLRDQRRSKAYRSLLPDAGAPCDEVVSVDLSAVDPLVLDEEGQVRPVRELAGKVVNQVLLGGDSGASLRDLLAAAALLKSKRVPPRLELLLVPPSRQALEVLAQSGALLDLIATGARVIEPDSRIVTGELYPPPGGGLSLRTFDTEPGAPLRAPVAVCSAETLAFAVATGQVGDPRGFKRPVRVTVPRTLPTDDVLIVRKGKTAKVKETDTTKAVPVDAPRATGWHKAASLPIAVRREPPPQPSAIVLSSLEDLRWFSRRAGELSDTVRVVIAAHIPSSIVPLLSGFGILALRGESSTLEKLKGQGRIDLPDPAEWQAEKRINAHLSDGSVELAWLAVGPERSWTLAGHARTKR